MSGTATDHDERIRLRAYHMWEADGCPSGREDEYWHRAAETEYAEKDVDLASDHSFPASDPPANTGITGPGG